MAEIETLRDVIIVGSGPAGTAAALACSRRGIRPTMLDVGNLPARSYSLDQNLYDYASTNDLSELLIGDSYTGLHQLNPQNPPVSLALALPRSAHVRRDTERLLPLGQERISIIQSLAKGGLANAWGCISFRYNDKDLEAFPIASGDLEPYYDLLTKEMGINGADDDLTQFFGSPRDLQPPLQLGTNSSLILQQYAQQREQLNARGVYAGRMRLAVLTRDLGDRKAHPYLDTDMVCRLSAYYSPVYTLNPLIDEGHLKYIPRLLVEKWRKTDGVIRVDAVDVDTSQPTTFACRQLILAAGAVNSSRIALRSFNDHETVLPLLDNPAVHLPGFLTGRIGKRLDTSGCGFGFPSLACVFDFEGYSTPLQGLIFELTAQPRAAFYRYMPVNASFSVKLVRQILPGMVGILLYFPSDALAPGNLRLERDGTLRVEGPSDEIPMLIIKRVVRSIRKLGLKSLSRLAEPVPYGNSMHYVGCLPMKDAPTSKYHTNANGALAGEDGVHVVDGAVLPSLSSKNHTLTIMANSMRISTIVCNKLAAQQ